MGLSEKVQALRNDNLMSYLRIDRPDGLWSTVQVGGSWMRRLEALGAFLLMASEPEIRTFLMIKSGMCCVDWQPGRSLQQCAWEPIGELPEDNPLGIIDPKQWEHLNLQYMECRLSQSHAQLVGGATDIKVESGWWHGGWIWSTEDNSWMSAVYRHSRHQEVRLRFQCMAQTMWQWDKDPLMSETHGYQMSDELLCKMATGVSDRHLVPLLEMLQQPYHACRAETKRYIEAQIEHDRLKRNVPLAQNDSGSVKHL